MFKFVWGRSALNYLRDNTGLVNDLELAFADLRQTTTGRPSYGTVDEGVDENRYLWYIYNYAILIRVGAEGGQSKLWIEAIKPIEQVI